MTVCNWGPQEAMINVGNIGRGLVGLSCRESSGLHPLSRDSNPPNGRRSSNRSITVA